MVGSEQEAQWHSMQFNLKWIPLETVILQKCVYFKSNEKRHDNKENTLRYHFRIQWQKKENDADTLQNRSLKHNMKQTNKNTVGM